MKKLRIFTNCQPVRGLSRSVICDLTREEYYLIPNSLYEILTNFQGKTIDEIKFYYNNEYNVYIDDYFMFLENKEIVFWCDNIESFPDLSLVWDFPGSITNAIIDFNQWFVKKLSCNSA